MKSALLLVDLQNDFLNSRALQPAAGQVTEEAARLLNGCRALSVPVIHVLTTVKHEDDQRMPHWKKEDKWLCVKDSNGHESPEILRSLMSEAIVHKTFFSGFFSGELDNLLRALKADTLIMAGVHLHGCIRATAIDAYQKGFRVIIADDAVASDDPFNAAVTRRYLEKRAIEFIDVENILLSLKGQVFCSTQSSPSLTSLPAAIISGLKVSEHAIAQSIHVSPGNNDESLWIVPVCGDELVSQASGSAKKAWSEWRLTAVRTRIELLERFAALIAKDSDSLAKQMAAEIGKPVTQGKAEVARTVMLLKSVMRYSSDKSEVMCTPESEMRYRPLGTVAIITPWNNPLAIPAGKIAPALFYGNTVVWKPAIAGSSIAVRMMDLLSQAGFPAGAVNLLCGDRSTALGLMSEQNVDAVTLSGSLSSGYSAQDICAGRHIPLQAELGGNNASVVWGDCDLEHAAFMIAEAAFGFAGQRCTANRRVIVDARCYSKFLKFLESAVAGLVWNDPFDIKTQVGPLISAKACRRVDALIERAKALSMDVIAPHMHSPNYNELVQRGSYFPPSVVFCGEPQREVVQEETFGPVMVVQMASDWDRAMKLCNSVRQGLVSALFSTSKEIQSLFLEQAQAGILKINQGTSDANAEAPFGGWKASGIGPPEHGAANREFYTRIQSVYRQMI